MSSDSKSGQNEKDLERWYSGYLVVRDRPDVTAELVKMTVGFPSFDVSPEAVELEYRGRDASRVILRTLLKMAAVIGHAEGEIECQISGDGDELWFEFYRIRDGRLFRQRGEVVRHPEQEVREPEL